MIPGMVRLDSFKTDLKQIIEKTGSGPPLRVRDNNDSN
jgi:hypothetical protein